MSLTTEEQNTRLDKQVQDWTKQMRRLAGLIAAAKGKQCALIMVSGTYADYADVIPELILQDVLRVYPHGEPVGFEIDLLNPAN
jgi:hypothetical protein